jgi:glycerol transport system permease protein
VPVCLVLMALPLLIPWNVVGTMWQVFGLPISACSATR